MKITAWTSYEKAKQKYIDPNEIKELTDIYNQMQDTVIKHCKEKEIRFSGDYHQYGEYGIPIIDDKYILFCTSREWGWIMAQADENNDSMGYLNYYLHSKNHLRKYPNEVEGEICL